MARSHAKVLTSVWRNDDWLALSPMAKLLYLLLLSQPKLTLVGVLDYLPARWAPLIPTSPDKVEAAAVELHHAEFVVLDEDTDELLIRSFMKHDLTSARMNVNLVKGVWSAWEQVASDYLRDQIVRLVPDTVWACEAVQPPAEATRIACSEPLERTVTTDRLDAPSEGTDATTSLHSPLSSHLSSETHARDAREDKPGCSCVNGIWLDDEGRAHRCEHSNLRVVS